jgi:hypothetical protein
MPKLTDPGVWEEIKRIHNIAQKPVEDDLTDEERWKRKEMKDNNTKNQAR